MPSAINGTGTQYYGHADPQPRPPNRHALSWLIGWLTDRDDSHESWIVTEWITVLWVPLLPLGSFRVWRVSYDHMMIGNRTRTGYRVKRLPIYWPQVLWGYAITATLAALGLWQS